MPLAALLSPAPATATVIVKLELPDLVTRARAVFVGKVTKRQMHWTADRKHIVTDTTSRWASRCEAAPVWGAP